MFSTDHRLARVEESPHGGAHFPSVSATNETGLQGRSIVWTPYSSRNTVVEMRVPLIDLCFADAAAEGRRIAEFCVREYDSNCMRF